MRSRAREPDRIDRRTHRALWALILAQGALFATLGLARYRTFHNETFDLAFYTRIAWGLVRGDFWEPMVNAHVYGLHLSPILVPLGALGALTDTPSVLILAQAAALALAAVPLARIGMRHLGPEGLLAGAIAWLFYPNLGHVAGYEFHPGSLAALPLAWLAFGIDRGSVRALTLGAVGALLCREDLALVTAMGALLFGVRHRGRRRAAAMVGVGTLLYAVLFLFVLQPRFAPAEGSLQLHFGRFGDSTTEVAIHLLTHPLELASHLATPERLLYLPKILAPLCLLPLLRPGWSIPALPVLAINLISEWPTTTELSVHYLTPAVVFLVAGALEAAGWLRRVVGQLGPIAPLLAVTVPLLASHVGWGGTPLSVDFSAAAFRRDADAEAAGAIVAAIEPGASVQAPYELLPHLAERRQLQRTSLPEAGADYYVLPVWHRRRYAGREDLLRTVEEPAARTWMARADHRLLAGRGPYLLLERGAHPRRGLGGRAIVGRADPSSGQRIARCLAVRSGRLEGRRLTLELVARGPCPNDLALRIGSGIRPRRVDLPFGGWLSPVHLRRGDRLHSVHRLGPELAERVRSLGLRVGALRQSGARPEHDDPVSVAVPLRGSPYSDR